MIVFNKWESCDERRFDECLDRVGDLEIEIAWVKSQKGRVSMDIVFGIDGGLAQELTDAADDHDHDHDHHHDHKHDHQSEVAVLSVALKGPPKSAVNADKLMALLKSASKEEVYRIKAVLTASSTVRNSDEDENNPTPPHPQNRYILNWAFGRWTFTPVAAEVKEHESSHQLPLRMTLILARHEDTKWAKKLESGNALELDGDDHGELIVTKIG